MNEYSDLSVVMEALYNGLYSPVLKKHDAYSGGLLFTYKGKVRQIYSF